MPHWKRFIWHYVVIFLMLLAVAGFFITRHQLVQQTERREDELSVVFETVVNKQRMGRNLERWHDSSVIFAALEGYQLKNGSLPGEWSNKLIEGEGYLFLLNADEDGVEEDAGNIIIQAAPAELDLPQLDYFHIWPGYVCVGDMSDEYWVDLEELAYEQVIGTSAVSDFAIVYRAEQPETPDVYDGPGYIKCLDSLNGYDRPDFVFGAFKEGGAL